MAKCTKDTGKFECDTDLHGLGHAAKVCCKDVLGLKKGERMLIITNPQKDVRMISLSLYDAALDMGARPTILFQPKKTQLDFAEDEVLAAVASNPEVILSISAEKLGKDPKGMKKPYKLGKVGIDHIFTYLLAAKKIRSFWSPTITVEMFRKTTPIDYACLRSRAKALGKILDRAEEVRITAPGGTDLVIGLRGRKAKADDGDFRKPGTGGNIPCGEVYISPELGASKGVIAFDGSISATEGVILIKRPIVCTVKGGFVKKIEGGPEAKELRAAVKRGEDLAHEMAKQGKLPKASEADYAKNACNLGELGIGLNEAAEIVGNMLEDEKVLHTCHIAIGANYDEDAKALIHLDGLIRDPTMVAKLPGGKKRTFMKDGELALD